jgi:hypothetical protein
MQRGEWGNLGDSAGDHTHCRRARLDYCVSWKLPGEVREHHTEITAQSSQWIPNPDETGPVSLTGEDLNSVWKLGDQNPKVMNSCFCLYINWKRLLYDKAPTAVFRWLVTIIMTDFLLLANFLYFEKIKAGLWDCFAVCISPSPNVFDLYVVHVTSEGSRQLVLPWTYCFPFWY